MRLWSLHPSLLDRQGLTACWREGLLAQAVLAGGTRGYTRHPQLVRFRRQPEPLVAVAAYLHAVADEATARGYRFDRGRVGVPGPRAAGAPRIAVTQGQLDLEWRHLRRKLAVRSPDRAAVVEQLDGPSPHPLFVVVPGDVEEWERET
ncbi:pyrimidine dimer DNA glycosylase/DNA-(apurinic or apyrimidinic site) lyase [Cellulomonas flavigena DSM 20109]|uniref:Pyrimidine dimer DNA glycosylase/DNA-(Apurinic or apyrimidinic site) lyase n=1 Tax=Cellulomonas flavigena (strain ATCC 482 / DSM 20109 / BCRC 11376 / JCM 18109 / NBRC 3775 / NCIMB 8073 / NRS 134) TaxID=446466 RepID=D5UKE9_CELFN|nr:pyrimidine dimer DNA glycosylase/endonuclease V [Cellulomonas flavigena]ADG75810.1 pyrimidine dimer DNA glycosylase/DNA-(apurinic or apyrimidinic site) lyase [Cellulomonas flavigena DSM 20109]